MQSFCISFSLYYHMNIHVTLFIRFTFADKYFLILSDKVGRIPYTSEDDAAISSYVSKCQNEVGGNRLWQEMENQLVTNHTWQSMKSHYKVRLVNKQPDVLEVKAEEATKSVEGDFKVIYFEDI